jgi:coenzyme F420 hydrogenase subunit beta
MERENITKISAARLCTTCGGCFAVCPVKAIKYRETVGGYFLPVVDEDICTNCGLCYSICPGINFGNTLTSKMPPDPFAGAVRGAFVGKATDEGFFKNSQSGGIVSAILATCIESDLIKGAVTVSIKQGRPPRPMVGIARNSEQIYSAQKSKYCPVPLLEFIRELKSSDCPIAVVGVPCQLHGLCNILDKMPKLRSKIAFTVGLVCDRIQTFAALDYLIFRSKADKNSNIVLHYRDKSVSGYPGDVNVLSDDGKNRVLPAKFRSQIKDYFTPARCRICFDKMNVYSDITAGDPHGLEGVDRKSGESMLLTRTEKGQKIIELALNSRTLMIRKIKYEHVLTGQKIDKKRLQWNGYVNAWKVMGNALPAYYEVVRGNTPNPKNLKFFTKNLQYSLSIDNFLSRDDLFERVDKIMRRENLLKRLFFPVLLGQQVAYKLFGN